MPLWIWVHLFCDVQLVRTCSSSRSISNTKSKKSISFLAFQWIKMIIQSINFWNSQWRKCGSIVATIPMGSDIQTNIYNRNRNKWTNRMESNWIESRPSKTNNRTNILCNQLYQIRINYLMCVRLVALDVVFIGSFHFEWALIASFSLMLWVCVHAYVFLNALATATAVNVESTFST